MQGSCHASSVTEGFLIPHNPSAQCAHWAPPLQGRRWPLRLTFCSDKQEFAHVGTPLLRCPKPIPSDTRGRVSLRAPSKAAVGWGFYPHRWAWWYSRWGGVEPPPYNTRQKFAVLGNDTEREWNETECTVHAFAGGHHRQTGIYRSNGYQITVSFRGAQRRGNLKLSIFLDIPTENR